MDRKIARLRVAPTTGEVRFDESIVQGPLRGLPAAGARGLRRSPRPSGGSWHDAACSIGQSYYLRFDAKLWRAMQPYPPLGSLYAAAELRAPRPRGRAVRRHAGGARRASGTTRCSATAQTSPSSSRTTSTTCRRCASCACATAAFRMLQMAQAPRLHDRRVRQRRHRQRRALPRPRRRLRGRRRGRGHPGGAARPASSAPPWASPAGCAAWRSATAGATVSTGSAART